MIAALVLLACAADPAQSGGLQQATLLLKTGDARAALSVAESEPDALARARARVYVLHQSGALAAALSAAHSASDAYPDDAWLAQKWAFVAATLRRADAASNAAVRLESAVAKMPDADRGMWAEAVRSARTDAADLLVARTRRVSAERVARAVSFSALGGAIVALTLLALWPNRRQRMSRMPVEPIGSNKVEGGSQ